MDILCSLNDILWKNEKKKPPTNLIRRKYRKIVGFNIVANFAVVEFIQCLHKTPSIKRKHKRTHIQIGVASNGEFIDKRGIALHLWIDYTKTIDTEDLWQYYCYYSIPKNVKKRRKKNILILWIKILFGVPSKNFCVICFSFRRLLPLHVFKRVLGTIWRTWENILCLCDGPFIVALWILNAEPFSWLLFTPETIMRRYVSEWVKLFENFVFQMNSE